MHRAFWLAICITAFLACSHDLEEDRAEIGAVILEFNSAIAVNDFQRLRALFTADAQYSDGSVPPMSVDEALRRFTPKRLPWDERTALTIQVNSIRFPTRNEATAQATQSDSAPMTGHIRQWSCTFGMVKANGGWKIASYQERTL